MQWNESKAVEEDKWLTLMSQYKYDGYHEFLAGARFLESLIDWLQQFQPNHREAAYDFVRNRLIFISTAEIHHLVGRFYHNVISPQFVDLVAQNLKIPPYLVWSHPLAKNLYAEFRRKSLFIGLSDGARVDVFRRANEGRITNDQVSASFEIYSNKWKKLHEKLNEELKTTESKFTSLFLFDDFVGSGTTLLRKEEEKGWTGKLHRFWNDLKPCFSSVCEEKCKIHIHHFIGTQYGMERVQETLDEIRGDKLDGWFSNISVSYGLKLPKSLPICAIRDSNFHQLTDSYYDPVIETDSTRKGGKNVKQGFGGCGLPVILEHNTPNNSVALLWAETKGGDGVHEMRPLFRRKQRHWRE